MAKLRKEGKGLLQTKTQLSQLPFVCLHERWISVAITSTEWLLLTIRFVHQSRNPPAPQKRKTSLFAYWKEMNVQTRSFRLHWKIKAWRLNLVFSMSRLVVDLFMVIARNGIHLASGPKRSFRDRIYGCFSPLEDCVETHQENDPQGGGIRQLWQLSNFPRLRWFHIQLRM